MVSDCIIETGDDLLVVRTNSRSLRNCTFTDCSFRRVGDDVLPDYRHHGAAAWDRKVGHGFVMRNAEWLRFFNTEFYTS